MTNDLDTSASGRPSPPAADEAGDPVPQKDWRAKLRGSRTGTIAVLAVTALLVTVGAYLVRPGSDPAAGPQGGVEAVQLTGGTGPAPALEQSAPDFTVRSTKGAEISLASLRGRPVWLTFGASWCSACRVEAPDIQAAHAAADPDGLAVVAVYLSEDTLTVQQFADRLGLTFAHVPDPQTALAANYRVMGIPAHFFIDRQGVLRATHVGIVSEEKIEQVLTQIQ